MTFISIKHFRDKIRHVRASIPDMFIVVDVETKAEKIENRNRMEKIFFIVASLR